MSAAALNYVHTHFGELASALVTALGIWLAARRNILCWPVTLLADVLYFIVFYRVQLLSDTYLQGAFALFTLYGWWNWWRGVKQEGEVCVVDLPYTRAIAAVVAGLVGTLILGTLTRRLGASLPYLDASLAAFSLVGSWWQARKHIANWWLWIVVDVLYVFEYIYKGLWVTAVLYAGLVALAVVGLRDWQNAPRESPV